MRIFGNMETKYDVEVICYDEQVQPRLDYKAAYNGKYTMAQVEALKNYLHEWWINGTGCADALPYITGRLENDKVNYFVQ